ncbi:hypothetical protein ACMU_10755 [Actibacterium mucosum KCTC 23349]|uniref:Rhodanese domain-containing protein n=1 Tax=Actibacterium mucosum KCTC 23349 TaxID=1454373 RepID=A0A037ZKR1_9RHOB|nr:rhodanese-like domain-containing protein [Actibacterium mucosum]KAJ56224.1 hypothetical protein ACMU_10755 [Actibacterium mucosum KCTC 23349]
MSRELLSRRNALIGGGVVVLGAGAAFAGRSYVMRVSVEGDLLTPPEAHDHATAGRITLVDIRRPDEWAETGVGEGAVPLDMRRLDFIAALDKATGGDRTVPIALICARGVRSRKMTERLTDAGYTHIIDIPEGMLGSRAGPGWLKRGVPTVSYSDS